MVWVLSVESFDTEVLFTVYRPRMGMGECMTPRGFISVVNQPITNLFEVPSIVIVELTNNVVDLCL